MELTKEYFEQYLEQRLSLLPSKEDFEALKSDVADLKTEVAGLSTEISAVTAMVTDINEAVHRIDKRDVEDSDAHAKNFVNHEHRIIRIEKQLKLKPAA
jgi:hypothetical protein